MTTPSDFAKRYHQAVYDAHEDDPGDDGYRVLPWHELSDDRKRVLTAAAEKFMGGQGEETFQAELQSLLNRHSQEGHSNTPDFLLAEFITQCVTAFNKAVRARDGWYGVELSPVPDRYKSLVPPGTRVVVRCEHAPIFNSTHCAAVNCPNYAGRFGQ